MPTILNEDMQLTHTCEVCGEAAYFGEGVQFRLALNAHAAGKFEHVQELLGKWYCEKHWNNGA